jgi:putative Ig domain-containing protein
MKKLSLQLPRQFFAFALTLLISIMLIQGCASSSSPGDPNPAPFAISTSSLPSGQVGAAYSTTLGASGGTTPYTWTLTSGTLPTGLMLNAATGAITGTPTAPASDLALTFQVKDSGSPAQTKTVDLSLTISAAGGITVSISPKRGGLTITQSMSLTASTNDPQGVTWTASAGTFSTQSAGAATYVAPNAAGTVTVTATSVTDGSKSAAATIGVTDLPGMLTYHNNLSRDGVNKQEYALTSANVATATFGKLFACTIDAPAYAQPLWVANLNISGGKHNVVFVATSHDTVYAFDADANSCLTFWSVSLLNTGETYLNYGDVSTTDIYPDIGIVGTPVIDLASQTLYVVSKSKDTGTACGPGNCHQRLHALNLIDHTEKFGGPFEISSSISVSGTGDGSSSGLVPFNPLTENQRPGLVLVNGMVYVSWASHGDNDPYHGWVMGFAANNIGAGPVSVWNSTPNAVSGFSGSRGGIWMAGGAPAADSSNNLYLLTGNGSFDAGSGGSNYGDSTVKLSTSSGLSVADYFTPMDQANLNAGDMDHGAGGAAILLDPSSGPVAHLLIGGGKAGTLYLLNRDNGMMGGYSTTKNNVVQSLVLGTNEIVATAALWNNSLYIAASSSPLKQFPFNTATGLFVTTPMASSNSFGGKGATPSVSASGGSANGIVWALDNSAYGTACCPNGPAVLHAYDATNVGTELWNSTQGTGNAAGNAVKFTVPTVANGKVYVGTRSELSVYGLLPN